MRARVKILSAVVCVAVSAVGVNACRTTSSKSQNLVGVQANASVRWVPRPTTPAKLGLADTPLPTHETGVWQYGAKDNRPRRFIPEISSIAAPETSLPTRPADVPGDYIAQEDLPEKDITFYVHGFQAGSEDKANPHEGLIFPYNGKNIDVAPALKAAGIRPVYFFWDAEADERGIAGLFKVEAKMWDYVTGIGEEWRDKRGVEHQDDSLHGPIDKFGFLQLVKYLIQVGNLKGVRVTIAGHSLGHQFAIKLMAYLHAAVKAGLLPPEFLAKRLILLDMFASQRNDAVAWPGEKLRNMVFDFVDDVPVEILRTSGVIDGIPGLSLAFADSNLPLRKKVGEYILRPFYGKTGNYLNDTVFLHNEARFIFWLTKIVHGPDTPERTALFAKMGLPVPDRESFPHILGNASDDEVKRFNQNPKSLRMDQPMSNPLDIALPLAEYSDPYEEPVEDPKVPDMPDDYKVVPDDGTRADSGATASGSKDNPNAARSGADGKDGSGPADGAKADDHSGKR